MCVMSTTFTFVYVHNRKVNQMSPLFVKTPLILLLCLHPLPPVLPPDRKWSQLHPQHRERAGIKSAWYALMRLQAATMAFSPVGVVRSSSKEQLKVQNHKAVISDLLIFCEMFIHH